MSRQAERPRKSDLIEQVVGESLKHLSKTKAPAFERFVRPYYRHVPPGDILSETPEALFFAALAHWKFGAERSPGKAKLRAYNPSLENDGWKSDHTVVEIVTDNMPFLVDSVTAELTRLGLNVHLVIHPIVKSRRDKKGKLVKILESGQSGSGDSSESFMRFDVTAQSGRRLGEIRAAISKVLADVRAAVKDWRSMRSRLAFVIDKLETSQVYALIDDKTEVRDFLRWVHHNNFTLLGYREYDFKGRGAKATVSVNPKTGLGILRDPGFVVFRELHNLASMPPEVHAFVNQPELLVISKTNKTSTVHRPVHMDSIGIKRLNSKGKVIGQRMFVGLFTSSAYHRSPWEIPMLQRKLKNTFERSGFAKNSHDGKALLNIMETFPRDELFQVSEEHLFLTSLGILNLQERQRVALFIRRDDFERFISCLVYVPRDNFTTQLRQRFQKILEKSFAGKMSAFYTQLGDLPLARLNIIIRTKAGKIPAYDPEQIEAKLVEAARLWTDRLNDALISAHGEEKGLRLFQRYGQAFKPGYTTRFSAQTAVADIDKVEEALAGDELAMSLYRLVEAAENKIWFKVYHIGQSIFLSDILPMLEHMGLKVLDEMPYSVRIGDGGRKVIMIHDFGLMTRDGEGVDLDAIRDNFKGTFKRVWLGEVESDGFNALVLHAGLSWRDVVILRAYCKYLLQATIAFSQAYMEQTLTNNPDLSRQIVELFKVRLDPSRPKDAESRAETILKKLNEGLDAVVSADEDRILRRFINLVEATLRTNFFQSADRRKGRPGGGAPKPYLSFKLDSRKVEELPLPRPMVEVFVYSPRVEAIHLRGGKVARGGIRWSDRREDFRTEILGLMKAQMVKNAVIVPVGSKGGFVVKRPPAGGGREALIAEGIECYKTLMRGLLDVTDNLSGGRVVPPRETVRRDDFDPYLVVAADKGTATFSDIANGISGDYGFWLGDAFASGGSQGYDHKKMGITARGAWESVKRHFREMGANIQAEDFTVIGVGDMSGDVFGNGMLLSPHIKLVAGFNHLHIFVDPDPDPAKSFAERKRLFQLPRSSWGDYDAKLISRGGGVFERRAKSITLTPEIRKRFAIKKDKVTPNELIRVLLCAKADLLWFGGIGTYVKASHESHAEAGDRANDAVRVNASDLSGKVIGEGANMGMTQRARIEFALGGGRLNTDSIDNSAGVDCSDHEVNIKILIDQVVGKGGLTNKQRNNLLAAMTGEVGQLVLRSNYSQTQAISLIQSAGYAVFDDQVRLMRMLEKTGRLDRAVEFLPDEEVLADRAAAKQGLARPEIAVLMSYAKIWLYDELLDSDLPDDPWLADDLICYFPTPLRKKYKKEIGLHRLRREIIATCLTNSMINRVGGTFVNQLMEKTGMAPADIARAYTIARQVLDLRGIWEDIAGLDNKVEPSAQVAMLHEINRLIDWVTLWILRNGTRPLDIGAHIGEFTDGFAALAESLDKALPNHYRADVRKRAKPYRDSGVPEKLALRVGGLVNMYSGGDVVRLAKRRGLTVPEVAKLYFAVGTRFKLGRLRAASDRLESPTHWQKLAVAALVAEIYDHQLALSSQILDFSGGETRPVKAIAIWAGKRKSAVEQTDRLFSELWSGEINDVSMIAVASGQLRALAESPSAKSR